MWYVKLIVLMFLAIPIFAQKNLGNEWYVGITKNKLLFEQDTFIKQNFFDTDTQFYYMAEGNTSICDINGKLLLAISPFKAMNGISNGFIEGGEQLNGDSFAHYQNGVSPYSNTTLILPKGKNEYYVFITTTSDSFEAAYFNIGQWGVFGFRMDEIRYSVVDMNKSENKGKVIKNRELLLYTPEFPHVNITCFTATRHANGRDWWLIKPGGEDRQVRYKFLVTPDSIYTFKDIDLPWLTNNFVYHSVGQSCFSKDGTLYAESNNNCPTTIWNFDRCNGQFTLKRIIDIQKNNKDTLLPSALAANANGVCFSANNKYLYQADDYIIYQIDLAEPKDSIALHCLCEPDTSQNFMLNNSLQMTPTGQIYIGHWGGLSPNIDAVMHPDNFGNACYLKRDYGYVQSILSNGAKLPTVNPPNMINYALGALKGSPCDTIKTTNSPHTQWQLSPNPTSGNININIPDAGASNVQVQLYNVLGQQVQHATYAIGFTYTLTHSVQSLAAGLYFIKLQTNTGKIFTQKIIKN